MATLPAAYRLLLQAVFAQALLEKRLVALWTGGSTWTGRRSDGFLEPIASCERALKGPRPIVPF